MDAKTAFETAWQHAQQRSMEPEYTGEKFHGFHMTKEGITGRLRNLLWRAGYGIANGNLNDGLDKDRITQDVLSGDILMKRGIGRGTLREICVWLWPSNNGFHADRAIGPDNSEHSPETRPAGEP